MNLKIMQAFHTKEGETITEKSSAISVGAVAKQFPSLREELFPDGPVSVPLH